MYLEFRSTLIKKMEKIYLIFCLCMNRAKLVDHKKANLVAEENELLREDFMKCLSRIRKLYDKGHLVLN